MGTRAGLGPFFHDLVEGSSPGWAWASFGAVFLLLEGAAWQATYLAPHLQLAASFVEAGWACDNSESTWLAPVVNNNDGVHVMLQVLHKGRSCACS